MPRHWGLRLQEVIGDQGWTIVAVRKSNCESIEVKTEPDEFGAGSKFHEEIQNLLFRRRLADFGPLIEPRLEHFGITSRNEASARLAYDKNAEAAKANAELTLKRDKLRSSIPLLGHIACYLAYPYEYTDPLGVRYAAYLDKMADFHEIQQEIASAAKRERELEIQKKKAEYWFSLGGFEFEVAIEKLFVAHFGEESVVRTKGTGDGGVDIIVTDGHGDKVFIQCKAHKQPVGPHIARDLYGAMQSAGVRKGMLISLGGVTRGVREFIANKEITVFDVNHVVKMHTSALEGSRNDG
jgi:HJR/Mrr/RecB family endonuclease